MRIIFSIIRIVAGVLIFIILVLPLKNEVSTLKQKQANLNTTESDAKQYAALGQDVVSRYQSIDPAQVDRLKKMVPDTIDTVRLINDVNSMAKTSGMVLKKVDYNPEEAKKDTKTDVRTSNQNNNRLPYGAYTIRFAVTGTYKQFLDFMSTLENSLRILDITTVSFNSVVGAEAKPDTYEYVITTKAYWLKN